MKTETISYSGIKELLKSIDHFIRYKTVRSEPSDAMRFGTAFDRYLLEGVEPIVLPEGINLRTNEGKAQKAALQEQAAAENREIVTADDMTRLRAMKEAVYRHPTAGGIIEMPRQTQSEFFLAHPSHPSVTLHGKRDIYITEFPEPIIVDLKTCRSATTDEIRKAIGNLQYYIQAYLYMLPDICNGHCPEFKFLFVETEAPYGVQVVELTPAWYDLAAKEVEHACRRWVAWKEGRIVQTGYSDRTITVDMPVYLGYKELPAGPTIYPTRVLPVDTSPAGEPEAVSTPQEQPTQKAGDSPSPASEHTASAPIPTKRKERADKGTQRKKKTVPLSEPSETKETPSAPPAVRYEGVGLAKLDLYNADEVRVWDNMLEHGPWATENAMRCAVVDFEVANATPYSMWTAEMHSAFRAQYGIPEVAE
jgi:hypothetical protein